MKTVSYPLAFILVLGSLLCPRVAFAAEDSAKYLEIIYPDGLPANPGDWTSQKYSFEYRFLSEYPVPGTEKIFVAYDLHNLEEKGFMARTHWARVAVLEKKDGKISLMKITRGITKGHNGYYDCGDLRAYLTGYDAYKGTKGVILCLYCKSKEASEYSDAYVYLTSETEPLEQSFMFPYMYSGDGRVELYLLPPDKKGRAGFATRKFSGNMKQRGYSLYRFFEEEEDCSCLYNARMRGYRLLKHRKLPKNARKLRLPRSFEEAGRQ